MAVTEGTKSVKKHPPPKKKEKKKERKKKSDRERLRQRVRAEAEITDNLRKLDHKTYTSFQAYDFRLDAVLSGVICET